LYFSPLFLVLLPDANSKKRRHDSEDNSDSVPALQQEDEINAFRNRLKIKVKGEDIPSPCATFPQMKISKDVKALIIKNVEQSFWKEPTPIQMQAIPVLLGNRDVLASAPTGSGKTAAYLIPVLSKLKQHDKTDGGIRALLLAPTKELADQIYREVTRLSEGKGIKTCDLKKNIMTKAINVEVSKKRKRLSNLFFSVKSFLFFFASPIIH
jgi:ATP-dependent RNA helicase DDX52/ROK1